MLRHQLGGNCQGRLRNGTRLLFQALMRQAGVRDTLRARNQALRAGNMLEAHDVRQRLGLQQIEELAVELGIGLVAAQRGIRRRGKHQNILMESHFDIGHANRTLSITEVYKDGPASDTNPAPDRRKRSR